jgi:hypothetical protein
VENRPRRFSFGTVYFGHAKKNKYAEEDLALEEDEEAIGGQEDHDREEDQEAIAFGKRGRKAPFLFCPEGIP